MQKCSFLQQLRTAQSFVKKDRNIRHSSYFSKTLNQKAQKMYKNVYIIYGAMILSILFCTKISNMFFKKRSLVKAKKREEADATRAPIIIFRNETMEVTFIFCVFEYFVKWMEHYNGMPPSLHYHQQYWTI